MTRLTPTSATTKYIVFDMDGTIADLYGVANWLDYILNKDPYPYEKAEPLCNMNELKDILNRLKKVGYVVAVTSWLAKGSTTEYDVMVQTAKKAWLDYYDFPYDELHIVKYGTKKSTCTKGKSNFQILIDDEERNRAEWKNGIAIDPLAENIIDFLKTLV